MRSKNLTVINKPLKMKIFQSGKYQRFIIFQFLFLACFSALGQGLPLANPKDIGLSSERLNRIATAMNDYSGTGKMPGMVTLVARHGKIAYYNSFGMSDIEAKKEMSKDAMFRIASMSKAITTVAVMILFEEGHFLLTDPISKYIPEFSNPKVVMKSPTSDSIRLVPAKGEITIRQLLNHTSGITYGGGLQDSYYKKAGMTVGLNPTPGTIGEMIKKLAALPLISQPGEQFNYGMSIDVLGYLVEVVSKMPLDEFLRERLFEPLKMEDTYFSIPASKFPRLAVLYKKGENGKLVKSSSTLTHPVIQTYFSGGAGIISTASDYVRFAQMLLNKGELDGKRILSKKTIELMTSNSIGDKYIANSLRYTSGDKFGYGFGIRTERGVFDELESIGSYGWDGAYYTRFWVDPKEDLIGIFMSQMDNFWSENYINKFKVLVYQSIVD
jgi:CubicO group peptidase (beta-lactamase class C family)